MASQACHSANEESYTETVGKQVRRVEQCGRIDYLLIHRSEAGSVRSRQRMRIFIGIIAASGREVLLLHAAEERKNTRAQIKIET